MQTDNINGLVLTRDSIEEYIITKIGELSRDWDYDNPITPQSRLFGELGLESLDAVVLATAIQEHFQRNIPFAELFAEIGREQRDLTIGEMADFVQCSIAGTSAIAAEGKA